MKQSIQTQLAPAAIGTYSQAVQVGNMVFLSGQIPLDPKTMQVVEGDFASQVKCVFNNLKAVAEAAGGKLDSIVRLTVYLTDINNLAEVNEVMTTYFNSPYPARTSIGVAALPKGVAVEVDAIIVLPLQSL